MHTTTRRIRFSALAVLSLTVTALLPASADMEVGFLCPAGKEPGSESAAAQDVCRRTGATVPLRFSKSGRLETVSPRETPRLPRIIWIHCGDGTDLTPLVPNSAASTTLRDHVAKGGALYLSGAGLALAHELGLETIRPRRGGPGRDGSTAAMVPAIPDHPVFKGLSTQQGRIPLSSAGFPAFADWHGSGGPSKGMLLARSPGGSENPLAEFALGKGRVIVMGWRLPHYANKDNRHRRNLERLTANILAYLSTPGNWRKIVPWKGKPAASRRAAHPPRQRNAEPNWEALELAVRDLMNTFRDRYPPTYLDELQKLRTRYEDAATAPAERIELAARFKSLQREALLANPLLDFNRILAIRRKAANLGLPTNWQGNCSVKSRGHDNALVTLGPRDDDPNPVTLYQPSNTCFIGDVDLHWDAKRMLVSMPGTHGRWQIHELAIDGSHLRELPLINEPDVDNYDACYLPDGNIVFSSTATFTGVPCVRGGSHVANLYLYEAAGDGDIRRLTFDQDHDWCPTVLNNGRVMYLRWEYSDIPHFVSRILFHMNPDGTEQMEYYGSNSYWPNAMFYARPVPDHPTRFIAIVGGHHDVHRMGELVLFDPARGRFEADGVIQRIPGHGKRVEPVIRDGLVRNSWPKYLHPWPLSSRHFLVAAQPHKGAGWGLYLADVFDNLVLVKEEPGYALLEPIPIRPTPCPPAITPKVDTTRKDSLIYLADVYAGPGLRGIPRGTVKQLRLFTYHFSYRGMGGQIDRVGLDGPWDVKRIMGTVPVEPDGSAYFRVPANTPISVQPLDADGKALQLMRSWMTAMPGETLSCVGCHEPQNTPPPSKQTIALQQPPAEIAPWYGPARGFGFVREVQPVLDAHCIRCHDGKERKDGLTIPDFTRRDALCPPGPKNSYQKNANFTPAYLALRRFVRSPTIESDMHLLSPCEFHADTSELIQKLRDGHSGVQLDKEGWDRLITWIDLGTPAHGTWHENCGWDRVTRHRDRRRDLKARYAGIDEDPEAIPVIPETHAYRPSPGPPASDRPLPRGERSTAPSHLSPRGRGRSDAGGPGEGRTGDVRGMTASSATAHAPPATRTLDLGDGVTLTLCRAPGRDFWIGKYEVTNEQFTRFDPEHHSRLEHGDFLQFSIRERGYPMNAPRQPVVRVSWRRAMAFCRWLSETTDNEMTLPTGEQWEYACRAGTTTAMFYGSVGDDFAPYANLADRRLLHVDTFGFGLPSGAVYPWRPAAGDIDDGHRVSAPVGSFKPNAWGLHDMHGNVAEWTLPPSPVAEHGDITRVTVRGGSWYRRPHRATATARTAYHPWQGVFDVGFRVVCSE